MLKQCLASQLYANFIENFFTNGLLYHDHILKLHDQRMNFRTFQYPSTTELAT